ncbi:MAG: nitric oxide reductase activation protein NorD, partial [Nitrospiria bacterium]
MTQDTFQEQLRALIAGYSEKSAAVYTQTAQEVLPLLSTEAANRWVEMGCILAQASAAAAVKYFRESPEIIRAFANRSDVQPALEVGLRLVSQNYGIALEYFRQCPRVLPKIGAQGLWEWAQIAADLASQSDSVGYGTAIEYLRSGPQILDHLAPDQLSNWAQLGLILAQEDQKSKDFLSLEYFRLTPELIGQVRSRELHPALLEIALLLAKTSSKLTLEFLKHSPAILAVLNVLQTQKTVLAIGKTLAQVAPAVVPEFIGHSVEALALAEGSLTQFQQWAQNGIGIARTNQERAGAYFSLKLKISHDVLRQLSKGVFLRDISRMLRFYAEGLCGKPVEINVGSGSSGLPTKAEGVITLPEKIALFTRPEDNFRFYKVMTFHESGHLEFGSYNPISPLVINDIQDDTELGIKQALKAHAAGTNQVSPVAVQDLLGHFPDTPLARNLWIIVEEGRIDYLLRHEYMGIRKDMDFVVAQQIKGRPTISELPPRHAILEALLQLSVADTTEVPLAIADVVAKAYAVLKTVQHPNSTVDDSFKAVCSLYLLIKKYLQGLNAEAATDTAGSQTSVPEEDLADERMSMGHGTLNNMSYRNPLDLQSASGGTGEQVNPESSKGQLPTSLFKETKVSEQPGEIHSKGDTIQDQPALRNPEHSEPGTYYYDEWDIATGDYRPRWCRLEERILEDTSSEVVDRIKDEYGAIISLLRRYFEYLRPEAFKKIKKQQYGEEIDLDSAVASFAERRAGMSPSDRVYTLRQKKTRDVSAAFLIDMSGSTSQLIGPSSPTTHPSSLADKDQAWRAGKRVIDVEKEGLLLLAEALDAIGDEFAMFGFSGNSRNQVNFYKIKDFDEAFADPARQRIGSIQPLGQNRDGTAIRHVSAKLLGRPAKIKLLILLSDGKPLDEEYNGVHALEDTRMALREARARGIHPFCITVDRGAREYIQEMYGEISYTIISNIAALPQRLPRIYK